MKRVPGLGDWFFTASECGFDRGWFSYQWIALTDREATDLDHRVRVVEYDACSA